jgi:hypothetical protein
MSVLEGVPEMVVDAGLVPDEQDLAAFGGSVTQLPGAAAFDDGDVVGFLFAVFGVGHVEAAEVMGAQVQAEEVTCGDGAGVAFGVLGFGIEAGGVVVVAVHGVEVPAGEFGTCGVGIGDALAHGLGGQAGERGDVGKSAWTLEGFEEVAGINVGDILVGVILEQLLAGGRSVQATQDAKQAVVNIGNPLTVVSAVGTGIEGEDVGEESLGELGIEQRSPGNHFPQPNRL